MRELHSTRLFRGALLLVLLVLAAAIALVPNWDQGASHQAEAADTPNVDLSMEVVGAPGCNTDADPPEGSCDAPAGTFTVRVSLNSIEGLQDWDGDGTAGYRGVQVRLLFSEGMSFREMRMVDVWPDCASTAIFQAEGTVLMGCIIGIGANASVYLGPVLEVDFACPSTPSEVEIALLLRGLETEPPDRESHVIDELNFPILDMGPSPETLTIDCTEPPLPPPPPPSPGAMALDCDASTPGVQDDCSYSTGSTFDVQVHVTEPPTSGFLRFQVVLGWDNPPLVYLPAAAPADEALWPHCDAMSRELPSTSSIAFGCAAGSPSSGDTAVGPVLQFQFQCQQDGIASVGLFRSFAADTFFLIAAGGIVYPDVTGATVTCGPQFDLAGLSQQELQALNAGDVDGAVALFTEGAVLEGTQGCLTPCVGREAIRLEFESLVADGTHSTVLDAKVSGNTVTRMVETTSNSIKAAQLDRIVVKEILEFTGNKIFSMKIQPDLTDEQTNAFVSQTLASSLPSAGIDGAAVRSAPTAWWYALATTGLLLVIGGLAMGWSARSRR